MGTIRRFCHGWCPAFALRQRWQAGLSSDHQRYYISDSLIASEIRSHRYRELTRSSREIRILDLLPGQPDDPVRATLFHVHLQREDPSQQADWACLSYCWNSFEQQKELIWLNGKPFHVTRNLYRALQHLRNTVSARSLWIDQICIDQKDVEERSWQVQLMGEIFRSADSVVAWLGADDWSTRTLIAMMAQLSAQDTQGRSLHFYDDDGGFVHPVSEKNEGSWLLQKLLSTFEDPDGSRLATQKAMRALKALFMQCLRNPWFERMWIVQEAALAQKLFLQSGHASSSWETFKAAFDTFYLFSDKSLQVEWEKFMSIHRVRSAIEAGGNTASFSLSTLVHQHRNRQCHDPRDKVYALLGLTSSEYHSKAWIDYSRPVQAVYASSARRCIREEGNLDVLRGCCVGVGASKYKVPSWTKDWSQSLTGTPLAAFHCGLPNLGLSEIEGRGNSSTIYGRGAVLTRTVAKHTLALNGIQVDVIDRIAPSGHSSHLLEIPDSSRWQRWQKLATEEWKLHDCSTKAEQREVFWRTLVANHRTPTEPATAELGLQFEAWWNKEPSDQTEWRFMLRYTVQPSSRMFITKRGYLGLTCEHALPGDKVCVLWGGKFLFLLRERTPELALGYDNSYDTVKHFLIGGDTYVHGLVEGEGLLKARGEGVSEETFVIE